MPEITISWYDNQLDDKESVPEVAGTLNGTDIINPEKKKEFVKGVYKYLSSVISKEDTYDIFMLDLGTSYRNEPDKIEEKIYSSVGMLSFVIPFDEFNEKFSSYLSKDFNKDLSKGDYSIKLYLNSRLDKHDNNNGDVKPYSLIYMLEKVHPGVFISNTSADSIIYEPEKVSVWSYLIVYQFEQLLLELKQQGLYSTYVTYRKNDDRVRGTIDYTRHLKLNMGMDNGKIAYRYRRRTVDNPLNHLILKAHERLKADHPEIVEIIEKNEDFRQIISELKNQALGYSSVSVQDVCKMNSRPISHPFYGQYELMRKLCIHILMGDSAVLSPEKNEDYKVHGYLINMNKLFEDYVKTVFLDKIFEGYTVNEQFSLKLYKTENSLNFSVGSGKGTIRPDYVINDTNGTIIYVMDAKNKPAYSGDKLDFSRIRKDILKLIGDTIIANYEQIPGNVFRNIIYNGKIKSANALRNCITGQHTETEEQTPIMVKERSEIYNALNNSLNAKIMKCAIIAPLPTNNKSVAVNDIFVRSIYSERCTILPVNTNPSESGIDVDLIRIPFLKHDSKLEWDKWKPEMDGLMNDLLDKIPELNDPRGMLPKGHSVHCSVHLNSTINPDYS